MKELNYIKNKLAEIRKKLKRENTAAYSTTTSVVIDLTEQVAHLVDALKRANGRIDSLEALHKEAESEEE